MFPSHPRLPRAALTVAVVASVPYVVLKLMWLSGSTIGMTGESDSNEMSGARFVTGNVITVLLIVVAVAFLAALLRPAAARVPAWIVFVKTLKEEEEATS